MTFDEWLYEIEAYSTRLERLYSEFPDADKDRLLVWLKTSYDLGYKKGYTKGDYMEGLEEGIKIGRLQT